MSFYLFDSKSCLLLRFLLVAILLQTIQTHISLIINQEISQVSFKKTRKKTPYSFKPENFHLLIKQLKNTWLMVLHYQLETEIILKKPAISEEDVDNEPNNEGLLFYGNPNTPLIVFCKKISQTDLEISSHYKETLKQMWDVFEDVGEMEVDSLEEIEAFLNENFDDEEMVEVLNLDSGHSMGLAFDELDQKQGQIFRNLFFNQVFVPEKKKEEDPEVIERYLIPEVLTTFEQKEKVIDHIFRKLGKFLDTKVKGVMGKLFKGNILLSQFDNPKLYPEELLKRQEEDLVQFRKNQEVKFRVLQPEEADKFIRFSIHKKMKELKATFLEDESFEAIVQNRPVVAQVYNPLMLSLHKSHLMAGLNFLRFLSCQELFQMHPIDVEHVVSNLEKLLLSFTKNSDNVSQNVQSFSLKFNKFSFWFALKEFQKMFKFKLDHLKSFYSDLMDLYTQFGALFKTFRPAEAPPVEHNNVYLEKGRNEWKKLILLDPSLLETDFLAKAYAEKLQQNLEMMIDDKNPYLFFDGDDFSGEFQEDSFRFIRESVGILYEKTLNELNLSSQSIEDSKIDFFSVLQVNFASRILI